MLRETKVGLVVASCFLGLVGTVVFLKYTGDPLAAGMASANVAETPLLEEPTPIAAEPAPPAPSTPSTAAANPTPALENLGSAHGLRLVSTTGDPKPAGDSTATPPNQPVERRTVPPQPEDAPATSQPPTPSEPTGPPAPTYLASNEPPPGREEKTPGPNPEASLPASTPPAPPASTPPAPSSEGPLAMPPPDALLGRADPRPAVGTENHTPPATGPVPTSSPPAATPNAATTPPETDPLRPVATLGSPETTPAANPPTSAPTEPTPRSPGAAVPPGGSSPDTLVASGPIPPIGAHQPPAPPTGGSAPVHAAVVNPPLSVPAQTAPIVPSVVSFDEETYTCKAGDTLGGIAQQHYHSDKYERALLMFNRDHFLASPSIRADPPTLQPGQSVYIPQVKVLENRYPNLIPGLTPLPAQAVAVPTPPAPPRTYQVQAPAGEMMRDIAARSLGNPERWADIYRMNGTLDPSRPVPAGTVLQLP